MPLLQLWKNNPETIGGFAINQVVSAAGDGKLRDGSICSSELREYLSEAPTAAIETYISQCLDKAFSDSGLVLQDLINEIGRRLDYVVTDGRYSGVAGQIGFDGLWRSEDSFDLVVEVKTTDSYRISLDSIAAYRRKLIDKEEISSKSSILIVVGRNDTGELEAQIRGSRHAWDVRLISADSLIKLLQIKENSNDAVTSLKIRSLFAPVEYTRLDGMVDIVFTAVTDSDLPEGDLNADDSPTKAAQGKPKSSFVFTDSQQLHAKRLKIIEALSKREQTHLLQKTRAMFSNPDKTVRAVCSISKRYEGPGSPYWYAYHPQWDAFLAQADTQLFVLGCMDLDRAFAIPRSVFAKFLDKLNQTKKDSGAYWHVHLIETENGMAITIPNGSPFEIEKYSIAISD